MLTTFDKIYFCQVWYSVCGFTDPFIHVSPFHHRGPGVMSGSFVWGCQMAKEFTKGFYKTRAWKACRAGYIASVGGLCERCLRNGLYVPGVIVHHKTHINPDNINDPSILLDWSNLELLCRDCHKDEHLSDWREGTKKYSDDRKAKQSKLRYRIDDFGNVII